MDNLRVMICALFALTLFLPIANATNYYEMEFYNYETGNPQTVITPSFRTTETNCTAVLRVLTNTTDLAGLGYTITTEYYSPDDVIRGISSRPSTFNATCYPEGLTYATQSNNSMWEAKAESTRTGGTSHTSILTTKYECGTESDWLNISTSGYDLDSRLNSPNVYHKFTCSAAPPPDDFFIDSSNMNSCTGVDDKIINGTFYSCCGVACVATNQNLAYFVMPFNTGESGIVEYDYSVPFTWQAWEKWGYYEIENPSTTFVDLSSSGYQGVLYLLPNTEYAFYVHGLAPIGTLRSANINISINVYTPDWDCSEWSECDLGQQYRTCTDPLGKVAPRIEYQACITDAFFNLTIGFENGYDVTGAITPRKCNRQWWPLCSYGYQGVQGLQYPTNWTVVNAGRHYFLRLSEDFATEGTRSLKMWYIPAGYQYDDTIPACNWSNNGQVPQIYQGVNDSLFIDFNITFPSQYMTIEYDVKRCTEPVKKWEGWCGDECYSFNGTCDSSGMGGQYANLLVDPSTGTPLYAFYENAAESWETKYIDISDVGLQVGQTYNLVFAVNPEHLTQASGECVYFDNVRISIRTDELPCDVNTCIGNDLYRPRRINDTVCVYDIVYNDRSCFPESVQSDYDDLADFCVNTTLYTWDNASLEWIAVVDNENCIAQQEQETILDVPDGAQAIYDSLEPTGYGFLAYLFAPIMIAIFIALGIAVYATYAMSLEGKSSGIVFMIIFCAVLGIFSVIGFFPFWFVVILITMSGLGIAIFLTRT